MIAGPEGEEVGVILRIVPGIANDAVEEEAKIKVLVVGREVETKLSFGQVGSKPYAVTIIDFAVTVCVDIAHTTHSGIAEVDLILSFVGINLLLCTEHAVSLIAHP